jgi:hypothetical protein
VHCSPPSAVPSKSCVSKLILPMVTAASPISLQIVHMVLLIHESHHIYATRKIDGYAVCTTLYSSLIYEHVAQSLTVSLLHVTYVLVRNRRVPTHSLCMVPPVLDNFRFFKSSCWIRSCNCTRSHLLRDKPCWSPRRICYSTCFQHGTIADL